MTRLNFMGDVMLGELLENYRRGLRTLLERTGIDPFEHVRDLLEDADANVANLECVLSDASELPRPFSEILIAPEKSVRYLTGARVNAVNTANNHALDHGEKSFKRSLALLEDHGIRVFGYSASSFFQTEPVVLETPHGAIGFLGYNISNFPEADRRKCVERIKAVVREAASPGQVLVVSMHWGEEYTNIPPPDVIRFGRELLEAGCDIIHGHHSHQVQGVVQDAGKIFAPSLGNFIFDQKVARNRITAVLRIEIREGAVSFECPAFRMNDQYQPVRSPAHDAYIEEITGYAVDSYGEGGPDAYQDAVARKVRSGHRANRLRMRARMLSHFWDYLAYGGSLMELALGKKRVFSVITGADGVAACEKAAESSEKAPPPGI